MVLKIGCGWHYSNIIILLEMILMPSNNTGYVVKDLFGKHPDKIALLLNPQNQSPHQFSYRYAIDNAAFIRFDEKAYFSILDKSKKHKPPMFIVCPDVVGCHDRTLALWHYYYPILRRYNYPMAFVAQDGCEPDKVPDEADWVFIGGRDPWKMQNVYKYIGTRPVHVGRVNGINRLRQCEMLGATSVDGTGWLRARDKKFYDFLEWFEGSKQGELF